MSNEEGEKKKLEGLRETYNTVTDTIKEREKQVKELKQKVPQSDRILREAVEQLNVVKVEEARLITEIRQKRATVAETRSSMQASRSRGEVLDSLLQQKREGNCPGLFGRLVSRTIIKFPNSHVLMYSFF